MTEEVVVVEGILLDLSYKQSNMSLNQILARPQPPLAQTPTPMAQALTP